MKRVVSIHGWGGGPDEGWRLWFGRELQRHGIDFINPQMPNTSFPQQGEWIPYLTEIIGRPDTQTYLIGHSLGSVAILRYLESLRRDEEVGGAVLIAGFTDDLGIQELTNFFTTPWDWESIRQHVERVVSIESDNDPYNLEKYNEEFRKQLHAETLLLHDKKHFSGDDGMTELPEVLDVLLRLHNA